MDRQPHAGHLADHGTHAGNGLDDASAADTPAIGYHTGNPAPILLDGLHLGELMQFDASPARFASVSPDDGVVSRSAAVGVPGKERRQELAGASD